MGEARKGFRFGLRARLNIILIVGILLISLGLMQITYVVYRQKVDSVFLKQAESAARDAASGTHISFQLTSHLRKMVDTDEYREVRARAVAANDAQIIEDWMRAQPPVPYLADIYEENASTVQNKERYTLYGDYMELVDELMDMMDAFDINDIYMQYVVDGVTYSLVDPWESLLMIGAPKAPSPNIPGKMSYRPPSIKAGMTGCVPPARRLRRSGRTRYGRPRRSARTSICAMWCRSVTGLL